MDDHHQQPIWPMIQGAANYAWNLVEEAWAVVWKPAEQQRSRTVQATTADVARREEATPEASETRADNTGLEENATVTDAANGD